MMLKLLRKRLCVKSKSSIANNLFVGTYACSKPRHLICFKQWTPIMVEDIIASAISLKCQQNDTHCTKLDILGGCKVTILKEINEPILNLAVSKAASFMGADDVTIVDKVIWDHDYLGRVFSLMSDIIFVSSQTHMCLQRLADQSLVPVICMQSRTHATLHALATVMSVKEEFGCLKRLNFSYLGPAHPVLNSYLLLCPMLGANIKYKCCCNKSPVSPLLKKASEELVYNTKTVSKACSSIEETLQNVHVLIAGPTTRKPDKLKEFTIPSELSAQSDGQWIFIHICPRGNECSDEMFNHSNARTFQVFNNLPYIVAALMAWSIKNHTFFYTF